MADPEQPKLTLLHGGKDMIETLEEALEKARKGELLGFVLCTVEPPRDGWNEPSLWWTWAHHEDMPAPFSLMLATVTCAKATLLEQGLS